MLARIRLFALVCLGALLVSSALAQLPPNPFGGSSQILYGASGSNGVAGILYTINTGNGAATMVAPITNAAGGGAIGITGLAFNPINSLLYGITTANTSGGNTVSSSLVVIDVNTGIAVVIGSLGFANSDITFSSDGTLFGYTANSSQGLGLTTINLATGAATLVGPSGLGGTNGGGLALGPGGTIYLSATGDAGTLDSLDPMTGGRTVGPVLFGGPPFGPNGKGNIGSINSMAFDAAGLLFAIDSNRSGSPTTTHLIMINPVTGEIIDLGISAGDLDALAFAPIPEPSSLVLGALGVLGLIAMRRRRKPATV